MKQSNRKVNIAPEKPGTSPAEAICIMLQLTADATEF